MKPIAARGLGLFIRDHRVARQMSVADLSDISGTAISRIWKIEHGDDNVTLYTLFALAGALKVTPEEMVESAKR